MRRYLFTSCIALYAVAALALAATHFRYDISAAGSFLWAQHYLIWDRGREVLRGSRSVTKCNLKNDSKRGEYEYLSLPFVGLLAQRMEIRRCAPGMTFRSNLFRQREISALLPEIFVEEKRTR